MKDVNVIKERINYLRGRFNLVIIEHKKITGIVADSNVNFSDILDKPIYHKLKKVEKRLYKLKQEIYALEWVLK